MASSILHVLAFESLHSKAITWSVLEDIWWEEAKPNIAAICYTFVSKMFGEISIKRYLNVLISTTYFKLCILALYIRYHVHNTNSNTAIRFNSHCYKYCSIHIQETVDIGLLGSVGNTSGKVSINAINYHSLCVKLM